MSLYVAKILLNDLDVSSSHMEHLIKDLVASDAVSQCFLDSEVGSVIESISSFTSLVPKFRSTLRVSPLTVWTSHVYSRVCHSQAGIEQLFNQLLRPKLRMFIPDVYKDVTYVLDDDSYAAAEYNDVIRKRFIKAWEALVEGYKVIMPQLIAVTIFSRVH
jgi:conserved oligomeric Golgi complex subunit 4